MSSGQHRAQNEGMRPGGGTKGGVDMVIAFYNHMNGINLEPFYDAA